MIAPLIFVALTSAHAQPVEAIWQRKVLVQKCKDMQKEVEAWWPAAESSDTRTLTSEKPARAAAILNQMQYPSRDDVKVIQTSLKDNFANTFLNWIEMAGADCPQLRLAVGKALINTAEGHPEQKAAIEKTMRGTLMEIKYPTFLSASIDVVLVDYGIKHSLWKNGAAFNADALKLRLDLKQDRVKWQKEYDTIFSERINDRVNTSEESVKKFKAVKDLDKMKAGALVENAFAEKYFKEVRALLEKLK